ncbi:hypothetical protein [Actinomadura verrucosospora]|uniref:Uncharacterized protein n=1 Tax=Actinomadura verrucosospora TaxID=46165 RepID=A0A7D3VXI8_ACTVE|nr:hypothetical protein [Actinomadura verrucosospora]QKG23334.1 hypothetical protein ACTIVE_4977 [Actinomadura verrucosospora]
MWSASLAALAVYYGAVGVLGGWDWLRVGVIFLPIGVVLSRYGFLLVLGVWEALRGLGGGLVKAEYSHTTRLHAGHRQRYDQPWQQHYVYVDAEGRRLEGRHGVPYETSKARPERRFWLAKGSAPGLLPFRSSLFAPVQMLMVAPIGLCGVVLVLGAVPGVLIAVLLGVPFD